MKTLKAVAEALWHMTSIAISILCIFGVFWFVKMHVTCVDLISNWCVIH